MRKVLLMVFNAIMCFSVFLYIKTSQFNPGLVPPNTYNSVRYNVAEDSVMVSLKHATADSQRTVYLKNPTIKVLNAKQARKLGVSPSWTTGE